MHRKRAKTSAQVLLVFVALVVSVFSMEARVGPNLRFNRISLKDGLSQATTLSILQDRQGFLWFTSDDGLNRYDGYQIVVYRSSRSDAKTLSDSTTTCMLEDRDGLLWIGTANSGLNSFNPQTGEFTRYAPDFVRENALPADRIVSLLEGSGPDASAIWVGSDNEGLIRFDRQNGACSRRGMNEARRIFAMVRDPQNASRIWIGSENGLLRYDTLDDSWIRIPLRFQNREHRRGPRVSALEFSDADTLWVGTNGQGLVRVDVRSGEQRRMDDSILPDSVINTLLCDRDGQLWLGTPAGLAVLLPETETVYSYRSIPNVNWSLSDNMVISLLQDRSGLLWVGTWNGGVCKAVIRPGAFRNVFNIPGDETSLSNDNVRDAIKDESGTLWVGTADGLNRYDAGSEGWIHYHSDADDVHSLCYNYVSDLYEDIDGVLWVGTRRGLSRYDRSGDRFDSFHYQPHQPDSLSSGNIQRIVDDPSEPHRFLLIGTRDNGMNRFDKATGRCQRFLHNAQDPNTVGGNWVYAILPRTPQRIWIGTFESGVGLWDYTRQQFTHFGIPGVDADGMGNDRISCLIMDPGGDENILWLGTWGQGLKRFDYLKREFKTYSADNGFPSNLISGIVSDEKAWLWISTAHGIIHFDPVSEEFRKFEVQIGDNQNAFSAGAYSKSRDGEVFFGGLFGLTRFYPRDVRVNAYVPPLVFTSITVMDRELIGRKTAAFPKRLHLSSQDRLLSLQFSALSFALPEKNQYRYRLEGFDEDWRKASSRQRVATYTNLSPGSYLFRALGSNEDGVWNEEGLSLEILVSPPFWKSPWFLGAVSLFLLVIVVGGVRLRLQGMMKREKELKIQVDQRTRQLSRINRLIETINAEADISGLLFAILRELSEFFPVDRASALTWDKNQGLFRFMMPDNNGQKEKYVSALTQKEAHERYTVGSEELAPDIFRVGDPTGRSGHEKLIHEDVAKVLLVFRIPGEQITEGYLILENLHDPLAFSDEQDVDLLKRLRDPVLMAFRKAKMIEDLGEQREAAEKANLLKSRFLANMSHEIRTPMNAILGFTQLLSKEEKDPQKREQLQIIGRAGENLLNLINDILDFSKIESEMIEIVPVTFSLRKMLRHLEDLFRLPAENKELFFRLYIQERVPRYLFGDSFRLHQVLVNIVGNAVKFTRSGGITIYADYQNGFLELTVEDTGIGIPREKQEMIFQPFVQADDSTTREYGGTGLGLSICHKIVTLMNGSIALKSAMNEGSRFKLKLPMSPVSQAEISDTVLSGQESVSWLSSEKRLGIIEDQQSDLALLESILKRNGYDVVHLDNSPQVVSQVLGQSVDLVLLDIIMKDIDGLAVNEMLKRDVRTSHVPVIAVSGSGKSEECINFGILDYIRKPVREDVLLKRIFVTLSVPQQIQNVFVIDDDPMMISLYGTVLRKYHYNTFSFSSAEAALGQLERGVVPDVIILDLMMPKVSGFDFLHLLRDRFQLRTPVVVVTAKDLSAAELDILRKDTLAIFPKGRETGQEFISFLNGYFQRRDHEGQERFNGWQGKIDSPEIRALLIQALDILPGRVRMLGDAIHAENWQEAGFIAHDIKGLCANLGIEEVAVLAREINGLLQADPGQQRDHLDRLMVELNLIVVSIPKIRYSDSEPERTDAKGKREISILVVEDEPINRRLLEIYIGNLDRLCDTAVNGLEALEMMRKKPYDLVFLDIQMPVMSGLDVLARIRSDALLSRSFVVALTANAIKGDEEKYLNAGCDAYLPKPVSLEDIERMIKKVEKRNENASIGVS